MAADGPLPGGDDVLFQAVEGGAVIYDAGQRRMFALNTQAAFIWLALRDRTPADQICTELSSAFAVGTDEARRWLELARQAFDQVSKNDNAFDHPRLGDGRPPVAVPDAPPGIDYLLFDRTLRIDAPDEARHLIESLIGGLRHPAMRDRKPDLALTVRAATQGFDIAGAGDQRRAIPASELAMVVEQVIIDHLLPSSPHFAAFHAALLRKGRHTLLLPAPSGSGKTTLCAALAANGWTYGTDEMSFLHRDLRWTGLPFPPCIKEENYALIEQICPALRAAPEHDRFGRKVKFMPLTASALSADVTQVVFPRYGTDAANALAPIDPLDGLAMLLGLCIHVPPHFDADDFTRLVQWHRNARYFTLTFACHADAVQLLGAKLASDNLARE